MESFYIPDYLIRTEIFNSSFEVVGEPRVKTDQAGIEKISGWNGLPGWIIPLEYIAGSKKKALPSGKDVETFILKQFNVTIWKKVLPDFEIGDYVTLDEPLIGAVQGNIFVQAMGIQKIKKEEFSLNLKEKNNV